MSPRYERRQRGGGGALLLLIAAAALVVAVLAIFNDGFSGKQAVFSTHLTVPTSEQIWGFVGGGTYKRKRRS